MMRKDLTPPLPRSMVVTGLGLGNFKESSDDLSWSTGLGGDKSSGDEMELLHSRRNERRRSKRKSKYQSLVGEQVPDENDNTIYEDTYTFVKSYVQTSPNIRPDSREMFESQKKKQKEKKSFGSVFEHLITLPSSRTFGSRYQQCSRSESSTGTGTGTGTKSMSTEQENDTSLVESIPSNQDPKELTAEQRNKNLQLLRAWTDEGRYSRVQAMTIASTLYNTKVTEADIRAELTPKEKFAYKKFCLEIEDKLQMITKSNSSSLLPRCREPQSERTMRKMWHLYALYTKALSDEIWDESYSNCPADITSRAIAHLVKRTVAGPEVTSSISGAGPVFPTDSCAKSLKPIEAMEDINPVLANCLKDPIHAFLIVYGRYVTTGRANNADNRLRKLVLFNQIAKEFFEKLVEPPEDVDIDTYLLLLKQQQQHGMRYQQKRHHHRSTSMPFTFKPSHHHRKKPRKKRYSSVGSKKDENNNLDNSQDQFKDNEIDNKILELDSNSNELNDTPDMKTLQRKVQMLDGLTLYDDKDDGDLIQNLRDAVGDRCDSATSTSDIKGYDDTSYAYPPIPQEKRKKKSKKKKDANPSPTMGTELGGGGDQCQNKTERKHSKKTLKKKVSGTKYMKPKEVPKPKKKTPPPPSLRDMLCRSLLVSSRDKRPATVPFKEMGRGDKYILRGKFLPKGCRIMEDKIPPQNKHSDMIPHNFFVTPESHRKKRICLTGCRYEVLPIVAAEAGFELVGENDLWNINWSDSPLAQEKIMQMRRIQDMYSVFWGLSAPLQKTNHFPGMYEICRKDRLGRNLNRLKRIFPSDYNFFPDTWDLPTEQSDLVAYARRKRNLTFIIKPESGCQGKGIFLMKNLKKLSPFAKCVCQVYVPHPFLIDGYKFDQRIYVLITCVDPLRLYIYDEGIARFATVKYEVPTEENLEVIYMHLTNYSLNKFSESYVREGDGSKRKLSSIYKWMTDNGFDVAGLIKRIDEIVVKTLLCAAPTLRHNYKTSFPKKDRGCSCFELLGFDILIDRHLNPILLEVNHSPSFNLDLPVDTEVKTSLLKDLLNMVYLGAELNPTGKLKSKECQVQENGLSSNLEPQKSKSKTKRRMRTSRKSEENMTLNSFMDDPTSNRGTPKAIQQQFQHEIKHRGKFRLLYSSDKPGKYIKLMDETNTSYNGLAAVSWLHPDQQVKRRLAGPVVFESDPLDEWQPQRTSSVLKMTKNGQMYLETRLISSNEVPLAPKRIPKLKDKERRELDGVKSKVQSKVAKSKSKSKVHIRRDRSRSQKRTSRYRSRSNKRKP